MHPASRTVGVLHSDRTRHTVDALRSAARTRGVNIVAIEADKHRFPEAIAELNDRNCDSVLMIPDAKVYNAPNVKRLLLWGIRQKKPVWAFSASVVKAGALAGQYTDGRSVGQEAASLVRRVLDGTDVATIGVHYPKQVHRAVNERTAEMIGVTLPSHAIDNRTVRYGDTE